MMAVCYPTGAVTYARAQRHDPSLTFGEPSTIVEAMHWLTFCFSVLFFVFIVLYFASVRTERWRPKAGTF
jgi:hypothetical protein